LVDGLGIGDATGLGVVAGLGLGRSVSVVPDELLPRLPRMASAVPHPAISTISPTTAAMMSIHGVRWTGAVGPLGA
jgi:hypothetical protein